MGDPDLPRWPDDDSSKFTDVCSAERITISVALMSKINLTRFAANEVEYHSGDSELIQDLFNSIEQDDTRLLSPGKVRLRFTILYSGPELIECVKIWLGWQPG